MCHYIYIGPSTTTMGPRINCLGPATIILDFLIYISKFDQSNRILSLDQLILITKIRIGTNSGNVPTTGGFAGGSSQAMLLFHMAQKRCGILRYKITFCASIFN